ncbi:MAG: response regulator [Acidimicrobiia bacterium]|nr:response regulator [Acidimicrobiia bacterium]
MSRADDVFLTTEEVLDYLHVNLRTVYRLIKAGKIPAVRVGRQWRFRRRDVDAWLDGQRSAGGRPSSRGGRRRVLVVDDEENVRELVSQTLSLRPEYEVDTASDAPTALDRIRRNPYDLLVADLKMPGMDGLSLIRQARHIDADLPIIIITGHSSESTAIEAVNLGVAGYLIKPFRVPQVLEAADKALRH